MEELKRLIDVKSITTITLTFLITYLAIVGEVDVKEIYLIIISFYFGTQSNKGDDKDGKDKEATNKED